MLIVEERGYFWPNDVPIPERAILQTQLWPERSK